MLKGVNHRIIEVNRPDSLYFERAVFYLRPEVEDVPTYAALRETEHCLGTRRAQPGKGLYRGLWFLLGAAAAGACGMLAGLFR